MCDSGVDHVMERGAKRPRRAGGARTAASVAAASAAAVAGAEGWRLDHVALLTRSVEGTVAKLTQEGTIDGHVVGPIETFPAEGTRECYIGAASGKLLLMEAVGTQGPYARALAKRGPGLHHVAFAVPDLQSALALGGWQQHAICAKSVPRGTGWLFCRGVPTLLELTKDTRGSESGGASTSIVEGLSLPVPAELAPTVDQLAACGLRSEAVGGAVHLSIRGRQMRVEDLCGPRQIIEHIRSQSKRNHSHPVGRAEFPQPIRQRLILDRACIYKFTTLRPHRDRECLEKILTI